MSSFNSIVSPFRKTKYEQKDIGLRNFIRNCNDAGVPVKYEMVKEKALSLASNYGFTDFKASNWYIHNFITRKSIVFEKYMVRAAV